MDSRYKWPMILVAIVIVILLIYGVRSMDDSIATTTPAGSASQTVPAPETGTTQPQDIVTPPSQGATQPQDSMTPPSQGTTQPQDTTPSGQGTPDIPNTAPSTGAP